MPVICTCKTCGISFKKPVSAVKAGRGVFCSKKCLYLDSSLRNKGKRVLINYNGSDNPNFKGIRIQKSCPVCEAKFKSPNKTCSVKCGHKLRRERISGAGNPFAKKHPALIKKCKCCGSEFSRSLGKAGKLYCSVACSSKMSSWSYNQYFIESELTKRGFLVESEKTWEWLINPKTGYNLRVDIYIPKYNTVVEYDGRQHYELAFNKNEIEFKKIQERDVCKEHLLHQNNIRLIRLRNWPIDMDDLVNSIERVT